MCQYGFEEESHAKNTKTQRKRESLVVKEKNRLPQAYCSAELRTNRTNGTNGTNDTQTVERNLRVFCSLMEVRDGNGEPE